MDEDLTLNDLIDREPNPELRGVLECYRAAELALEAGAQRLGKMGQSRWQLAALSRARDLAWQAQRYIRIERAREHKLADFASDADTNPRGYPGWTAPPEPSEPTPMSFVLPTPEEVPDVDKLRAHSRHERIVFWCLNAAVTVLVIATIWLIAHYARTAN